MELKIAIDLIRLCVPSVRGQHWYDLGAGSGLFTKALANLLVEGSIVAVDKDVSAMKNIPDAIGKVEVKKLAMDFSRVTSLGGQPSGILMANSLHFVSDKLTLLKTLRSVILPGGQLIIIEYDMTKPNTWVPFPIDFESLSVLAASAGFSGVRKIGTTASRFQNNGMYSAAMTNPGNL